MLDFTTTTSHRRDFLARLGATAAAGVVATLPFDIAFSQPGRFIDPELDTTDRWLAGMKGKHRQIFDMPAPNDGIPQLHIRNYLNAYRDAYKVREKDVNAIGTLYAKTVPLAFQDSMWEKYKFGEALQLTDPTTHVPLARNMFAHPRAGDPFAFGMLDSSIEALQQRGVLFLLCNNALNFWAATLAKAASGTADGIRTDLVAHLLPGIVIVPAMVVAINKAQEHRFTYMYLP